MKRVAYTALGAAAGAAAVWMFMPERHTCAVSSRADTVVVTRIDTVTIRLPRPAAVAAVRTDTVWLPLVAAAGHDTVDVELAPVAVPIEQKRYELAEADVWVSGFRARLDSMQLRQPRSIVTVTRRASAPRWGVSVTAGAAITPAGVQPAVSVGVSYTLRSF